MREHTHEPERPERQAAAPPAPALPRILALQQSAGNRAVSAMLQRQAPPAAPANAQATAEAEAVATIGLLRATHRQMLVSADQRIRNTGQMMDAPGERSSGGRVRATPMTVRSDSAQLVADRGADPTTTTYYFYGTVQDNEHEFGPRTLGTIQGDGTIVIRGKDPTTGALRTHEDIIGTLVHETSHILVKDYGEHPETATDAASFDRYRDEFRAYFIEPNGPYTALAPDDRADAIRGHLVGTAAGTGGYAELNGAYWATPHASNTFRAQVLAHRRPDGFNLDNSPYLDRLVHLLRDQQAGRATVEQTLFQVTVLSPTERAQGAGATLITSLLGRLPAADADRIRRALTSPAAVNYGRELNPDSSPRVTAFLEAITARTLEPITEAYRLCDPTDRANFSANAHFLSWLGRVLPGELAMKTCITCMVQGRSFVYFERTRVFMSACTDAAGAAELPDPLRAALRALSFEVRLAYVGLCQEDYAVRVQPLQEPVRNEVRAILRGDREP